MLNDSQLRTTDVRRLKVTSRYFLLKENLVHVTLQKAQACAGSFAHHLPGKPAVLRREAHLEWCQEKTIARDRKKVQEVVFGETQVCIEGLHFFPRVDWRDFGQDQ